jgi:hypothetical protein
MMNEKLPFQKSSPTRVMWVVLAAIAAICLVVGIVIFVYLSRWSLNRLPKASTQGAFENGIYMAPNRNFTCTFPWQNVEGETLTDDLNEGSGWVKYRNDFGVNIAVQYMPERDGLIWPESHQEQLELLASLSDNIVSDLQAQFRNVALIYSEQHDIAQPAFFSVSKYNMDQNASSSVMRGDLLFFEDAQYYIITFAVFESSPMYRNNVKADDWVYDLDMELRKFYSECKFAEQPG